MSREAIIEKIRKLLALSDGNTNENEAIAAALKAQKLIAEHHIEQAELHGVDEPEVIIECETERYTGQTWRIMLATVIAPNFRCKAYRHSFYEEREGRQRVSRAIRFYGYESDANAAALVYEKLVSTGEYLARERCRVVRSLYGTSKGVKNSFLHGFILGVRSELEKQSQELMLVIPLEVAEGYAERASGFGKVGPMRTSVYYAVDRDAGFAAGGDAVRSGRLDAANETFLLA